MRQSNHRWFGRWVRALAAGAIGVSLATTVLSTSAGAASTPGVTSNSINIGATVPLTGPAACAPGPPLPTLRWGEGYCLRGLW